MIYLLIEIALWEHLANLRFNNILYKELKMWSLIKQTFKLSVRRKRKGFNNNNKNNNKLKTLKFKMTINLTHVFYKVKIWLQRKQFNNNNNNVTSSIQKRLQLTLMPQRILIGSFCFWKISTQIQFTSRWSRRILHIKNQSLLLMLNLGMQNLIFTKKNCKCLNETYLVLKILIKR
jgi:hypothetical protein